MALGRQQAGYSHAFQMDEMQRSWRMASGRQKAAIGRQMEYQEEMFSFSETGRGNQEERFNEQEQMQEERFQRERDHFEEVTGLQAAGFELQKRHIEEKYAMEMGFLNEQTAHIKKMRALEDKRREVTEKFEDRQRQRTIANAMQAENYYRSVEIPYQRWKIESENQVRDAHAQYLQWQVDQFNVIGEGWEGAINNVVAMLEQAFGMEIGTLGKADWKTLNTKIEEAPKGTYSPMPETITVKIGEEEFTGYVEGIQENKSEKDGAVEPWKVYN